MRWHGSCIPPLFELARNLHPLLRHSKNRDAVQQKGCQVQHLSRDCKKRCDKMSRFECVSENWDAAGADSSHFVRLSTVHSQNGGVLKTAAAHFENENDRPKTGVEPPFSACKKIVNRSGPPDLLILRSK